MVTFQQFEVRNHKFFGASRQFFFTHWQGVLSQGGDSPASQGGGVQGGGMTDFLASRVGIPPSRENPDTWEAIIGHGCSVRDVTKTLRGNFENFHFFRFLGGQSSILAIFGPKLNFDPPEIDKK